MPEERLYRMEGRDDVKTMSQWETLYRRSCYVFGMWSSEEELNEIKENLIEVTEQ